MNMNVLNEYLKRYCMLAFVSEIASGICAILLTYFHRIEAAIVFSYLFVASVGMALTFAFVGMWLERLEKDALKQETIPEEVHQ